MDQPEGADESLPHLQRGGGRDRLPRAHRQKVLLGIFSEEEPESIPVPASKETLITDLNSETRNFQNNANRFFWLTSSVSFGIASWITFL
jgi:hypothetical protein